MANYALGKGIPKDALLSVLGLLGIGGTSAVGTAMINKAHKDFKETLKKTRARSLGTIGGGTLGGLGGYGLTSLMTKNKLLQALGAIGGGVAGGLGGRYLADKYASEKKMTKMNSKFAKNPAPFTLDDKLYSLYDTLRSGINANFDENRYYNDMNYDRLRDQISNLDDAFTDEKWENRNRQKELKNKLNRVSTLLGASAGGLGGYGLTSLMTKNKLLKALGALGGGVAGGIIGYNL